MGIKFRQEKRASWPTNGRPTLINLRLVGAVRAKISVRSIYIQRAWQTLANSPGSHSYMPSTDPSHHPYVLGYNNLAIGKPLMCTRFNS